MERESGGGGNNTAGTGCGSRWNPTKEQINMLENLYKQGIRTPSAEQIEQITARLRAYGQIEGKNVFYWFQNHKARQRQRQKQQHTSAYFNRFLHTFSSPFSQNVACTPSYGPPQFFTQGPNVLVSGPIGPWTESVVEPIMCDRESNRKTLDLFPQHPTGTVEGKTTTDQLVSADSPLIDEVGGSGNQPYFEFFSSGQGKASSG